MGLFNKTWIAFAGAIVAALAVYFDDGIVSAHEWVLFGADVFTMIGVYLLPNTVGGENVNLMAEEALHYRQSK